MAVKFYWRENDGEGVMGAADRKHLLEANRVYALDFLQDIINEASNLYDYIIENPHGG